MNISWSLWGHHWLNGTVTGLYQGLALTVFIWLVLKCLPRTNAATRHAIRFGTLLVVASLPFIHWIAASLPAETLPPTPTLGNMGLPSSGWQSTPVDLDAPRTPELPHEAIVVPGSKTSRIQRTPDAEFKPILSPAPLKDPGEILAGGNSRINVSSPLLQSLYTPDTAAVDSDRNGFPSIPRATGLVLFIFCAMLAFTRLFFLLRQYRLLSRLSRRGTVPPQEFRARFEEIRSAMGVRRKVALKAVAELDGPIMMGFYRPSVLVPASLLQDLPNADWEKIIRHELAHVNRSDDWTNLWEQIIQAVLFYHPAVRWLGRDLALDREIACDDHVLAHQTQARGYALLLTQFASQTKNRNWIAAPAAWNHRSQLKQRIDMLLDQHRNTSPRLALARTGAVMAALSLVAAAALPFTPRIAFGQEETKTPYPTDDLSTPPSKDQDRFGNSDKAPAASASIAISSQPSAANQVIRQRPPQGRSNVSLGTAPNSPSSASVQTSSTGIADPHVALPAIPPPPPPAPQPPAPVMAPHATGHDAIVIEKAVPYLRIENESLDGIGKPKQRVIVATQDRDFTQETLERRLERLERLIDRVLKQEPHDGDDHDSAGTQKLLQDLLHEQDFQKRENAFDDLKPKANTPETKSLQGDHGDTFGMDKSPFGSHPKWESMQLMDRKQMEESIRRFKEGMRKAEQQFQEAARQHEKLTSQLNLDQLKIAEQQLQVNEKQVQTQALRAQKWELELQLKQLERKIAALEAESEHENQSGIFQSHEKAEEFKALK